MTQRRRTLPPVSPKVPAELRPLISAMTEILETGEGVRGSPLDRKVTLRDLLDSGIGRLKNGAQPDMPNGLAPGFQEPTPDLSTPPAPENFSAIGSFYGMVNLTWDDPAEAYRNHAFANIYRSEEDNFANAEVVGRDGGMFYSDYVRDDAVLEDDPTQLKGYYYWITFVSQSGVEGPPNSPDGTFAQPIADLGYVLDLITGELNESHLAKALNERISLIDGVGEGSVTARIGSLRTEMEAADQALAEQIDTAQASLGQDVAAVQTTLSANVERIDGELVALGASYTAQVQANGLIGGFGVYNDGTTVDAAFNVDRFWIGRSQADKRNPFVVVNGVVYIDTAMIRDASIQEGMLGPITVGKLRRPDGTPVTTVAGLVRADAIDVDALRIGFGQVSGDLQSTAVGGNGQPLWRLQRNGGFSLNSAGTGGRMEQTADRISVFDGSGRLRVRIGRL